MNGFGTRVRVWDKRHKIMLPSFPLYKSNFFNVRLTDNILIFGTGKEDVNDIELFDGDIIKLIDGCTVLTVKWSDEDLSYNVTDEEGCELTWESFMNGKEFVIIGNIWETNKQ